MHKPLFISVFASAAVSTASLQAIVLAPLSGATGGAPYSPTYQESPGFVLNDPFAYDPNAPAGSVNPVQTDFPYHDQFLTQNSDAENYWMAAVAIPSGQALVFLDVWGRNDYAGAEQSRHQDLIITLSDGVNSWSSLEWDGVTPSPTSFGRFDFTTAGVTHNLLENATSIRIDHVALNNDYLMLAEVRAGAVPEPSSTALLGLGCLALMLRRRK